MSNSDILSGVSFGKAVVGDVAELCELLAVLFAQESEFAPDMNVQSRALSMILEDERIGEIYIVKEGKNIVGMVSVLYSVSTALGGRVATLEDMVVNKSYRGKGVGSGLLDYAISRTKERGCKRITLLSDADNDGAHKFYKQKGFMKSDMVPFRLLF